MSTEECKSTQEWLKKLGMDWDGYLRYNPAVAAIVSDEISEDWLTWMDEYVENEAAYWKNKGSNVAAAAVSVRRPGAAYGIAGSPPDNKGETSSRFPAWTPGSGKPPTWRSAPAMACIPPIVRKHVHRNRN